jgi:hypothetical protein
MGGCSRCSVDRAAVVHAMSFLGSVKLQDLPENAVNSKYVSEGYLVIVGSVAWDLIDDLQ